MSSVDYRGQTALITGASSGLGAEFARQLAARGSDLILVARREDRLNELAHELRAAYGIAATAITLDLAAPGAGPALAQRISEQGLHVTTLVNNAGFGGYGPFIDGDPAEPLGMIQLNVAALVDLTRTFLPDLVRAGTGALINVASSASYQAVPNMAVYAATKAFVRSLTEALWYELKDTGVKVIAISPGSTRTEFFDVVGNDAAIVGRLQTPAEVVTTTLSALDRRNPPPSIISGFGNKLSAFAGRLVPKRMLVNATGGIMNPKQQTLSAGMDGARGN